MAAATVNTLYADSVLGDIRCRKVNVSFAATGDTYQVVGATKIFGTEATPPAGVGIVRNVTGDTITFNYAGGGAMAGVDVMVFYI